MMTLQQALPELAGDLVGALVREGRGKLADQVPEAPLAAWSFDEFAQSTYLHLHAVTGPEAVEQSLSFLDEIGVKVDLDNTGRIIGLEVIGYEDSLSRLP